MKFLALTRIVIALLLLPAAARADTDRDGGQLDVAESAVQVLPANQKRVAASIKNLDATDRVYCSDSPGVTTTNGWIVADPGETVHLDRDTKSPTPSSVRMAFWCVADGDGARVARGWVAE